MLRALLALFCALWVSSAQAAPKEKTLHADYSTAVSHLQTSCQQGTHRFQLNLGDDSKENDPESQSFGYTYFWIAPDGGHAIAAMPAMEYNELLFLQPGSDSLCKDTVAFAETPETVVIFVRQNNRPFDDELGVVFYDPAKNRVLAFDRAMAVSDHVEKVADGFAFKVYDPPTDVGGGAVTVRGHTSDPKEETPEYWDVVKRKGDRVVVAMDNDLTWERSSLQGYFKSQKEFDQAFGWDAAKRKYRAHWIYRATEPNCIEASIDRVPTSIQRDWHCDSHTPPYQPTKADLDECRNQCEGWKASGSLKPGMTVEGCTAEICGSE